MPPEQNSHTELPDLFRALELAHYAERFRGALFVLGLPTEVPLAELVLDLKVLEGNQVRIVLVVQDPAFLLEDVVTKANKRGSRFYLATVTDGRSGLGQPPPLDFGKLRKVLDNGKTPIIARVGEESEAPEAAYTLAGEVAEALGARKLFLVSPRAAALAASVPRSHVLAPEMEGLRARLARDNRQDLCELVAFVAAMLERGIPDIVVMEGVRGGLFREVFTHDGAGVLFNRVQRAHVRQARMADVTDITLLIRPEVEADRVRRVEESEIEAHIASYWVYEIDGLLVGLARLKPFGEWAELAQFVTLPRYRGKGRARELALRLLDEARGLGFTHVFALSVDERMWDFFRSLGFQDKPREVLPKVWHEKYDTARPSKALVRPL